MRLFYIWYFCTGVLFFSPLPFHLYKLFYDEGGEAGGKGPEEGLEFHRTQPEAFFGVRRELGLTFLNTGGTEEMEAQWDEGACG